MNNNIQKRRLYVIEWELKIITQKGVLKLATTMEQVVSELHTAFNKLNEWFFDDELPIPAITVMSRGKHLAYGWCTSYEAWSDKEGTVKMYEINISAEYLDRPYIDVVRTLLHEMVHLYNVINDVQDTSRGGTYHNKRFKIECERRGFYFEGKADKRYGWYDAKLREDTVELIESFGLNQEVFSIARGEFSSEKKKGNSYKWVCYECDVIVRSTKDGLKIICGECGQYFQRDDGGDYDCQPVTPNLEEKMPEESSVM